MADRVKPTPTSSERIARDNLRSRPRAWVFIPATDNQMMHVLELAEQLGIKGNPHEIVTEVLHRVPSSGDHHDIEHFSRAIGRMHKAVRKLPRPISQGQERRIADLTNQWIIRKDYCETQPFDVFVLAHGHDEPEGGWNSHHASHTIEWLRGEIGWN